MQYVPNAVCRQGSLAKADGRMTEAEWRTAVSVMSVYG